MRRSILFLTLLLAATALFAADDTCPTTWDYERPWTGQCATGTNQSPITNNANQRFPDGGLEYPSFGYPVIAQPVTVKNTSKEIKVIPMFDARVSVNGKSARLVQFHFHVPKEHLLDVWAGAAGELHLVHETENGEVIVVAVAISEGPSNPALAALRNFGTLASCESKASIRTNQLVPVMSLLPANRGRYIRYVGSLTTPPCSPNVEFILMNDGITATREEIAYLKLGNGNARVPQTNTNRVTYRVAKPGDKH